MKTLALLSTDHATEIMPSHSLTDTLCVRLPEFCPIAPQQANLLSSENLGSLLAAILTFGAISTAVFILLGGQKRWHSFRDKKLVSNTQAKRNYLESAKGSQQNEGQSSALKWLRRHGADLTNENFSDLYLDNCELDNTRLNGTSFAQSSLKNARFARTDISDGNFTNAKLNEANFSGCFARKADFSGAHLTRASFAQADLTMINAPRILASEAKFWDCDLNGSVLEESIMEHAEFTDATLTGTNLNRAALAYAALDGTCLQKVMLNGAHLDSATLQKADLRKAQLVEANLSNTDLENANLTWVHAEGANFSYAHLAGASLAGASLQGCDLKGAVLDGADLTGADLSGARNLTQDQICNAYYRGAETEDTERLNRPKLPTGLELPPMRETDSGY